MKHFLLLSLFFSLLLPPVQGQEIEQLTDQTIPNLYGSIVIRYSSSAGKIYLLNSEPYGESVRVYTLDPVSGKRTPVPFTERVDIRGNFSYQRSAFMEFNGQLLAKFGTRRSGYRLFSVTEEQVAPLTPPQLNVLTNPVDFQGDFYFLAHGQPASSGDRRSLELWKTDGSPGGTEMVRAIAETDVETAGDHEADWLVAGNNSLLIATSIPDDNDGNSGEFLLLRYRPDIPLQYVGNPGGELNSSTPRLRWEDTYANAEYDNRPDIPVHYFRGYFYFMAPDYESGRAEQLLYRLPEDGLEIETVLSSWPVNDFDPVWGEFADIGDALYLQVMDVLDHRVLLDISPGQSGNAGVVNGSTTQPVPRSPLITANGELFFMGVLNNTPAVIGYRSEDQSLRELFPINVNDSYKLLANEAAVYALSLRYADQLFRYRFGDGETEIISTDQIINYTHLLEDGSLIFEQLHITPEESIAYVAHYLDLQANTPRPIFDPADEQNLGATRLLGTSADGAVIYDALREGGGFGWNAYYRTTGTSTELSYYTDNGDYLYPIALSDGTIVFDAYNSRSYTGRLYTVLNGAVEVFREARTRDSLATENWSNTTYGSNIITLEYRNNRFDLVFYELEGTDYTKSVLVSALPYGTYQTLHSGSVVAVFGGDREDRKRLLVVDENTGDLLADTEIAGDYARVLALNESGYWTGTYASGSGGTQLSYVSYETDNSPTVSTATVPFPASGINGYALGDRFVFQEYSPSRGNDFLVADAESGTVIPLPEINVGPENGVIHQGLRIGDLLYFAGFEGVGAPPALWRTDGTEAGTYQVAEVDPTFAFHPSNDAYLLTDSLLYFSGRGPAGHEVYVMKLDSSEAVSLYADINPGSGDSRPLDFAGTEEGLFVLAGTGPGSADQVYFIQPALVSTFAVQALAVMELFPNPASDRVILRSAELSTLEELSVYDQLGRRVLQLAGSGSPSVSLDVSGLPTGVYNLMTRLEDGRRGLARLTVAR